MSDISKIQTNGETYDVKDATARDTAETANTTAGIARNTALEAQETADTAQSTAESKVSSVNIGTVTTGDSPSVTNSGTDKDVVMDFVFPSGGGGLQAISGTVEAGNEVYFDNDLLFGIIEMSSEMVVIAINGSDHIYVPLFDDGNVAYGFRYDVEGYCLSAPLTDLVYTFIAK